MIVLRMKTGGRRPYSYLTTHQQILFNKPAEYTLGHCHIPEWSTLQFNTWNDAVLGTKELFDNDEGMISINDYEPEEI